MGHIVRYQAVPGYNSAHHGIETIADMFHMLVQSDG